MPTCMVPGCGFFGQKNQPSLVLHVFPRQRRRIETWLQAIRIPSYQIPDLVNRIEQGKKGVYRICSRHFTPESYERRRVMTLLKKDAIPTLCLPMQPLADILEIADHSYYRPLLDTTESPLTNVLTVLNPLEETIDTSSSSTSELTGHSLMDLTPDMHFLHLSDQQLPILRYDMEIEDNTQISSSTVSETVEISTSEIPKKKRKYSSRSQRTIGTCTEYYPGQTHRSTQFDKLMGTKSRGTLCSSFQRSNPSKAIQCNMVNLPPLVHLGKVNQDSNMSNQTENKSCGARISEPISIAPVKTGDDILVMEDSEDFVEEEMYSQEEKQLIFAEDTDLDSSFIHIPEESSKTDPVQERKYLVYESCLEDLLLSCRCKSTSACYGNIVKLKKYLVESALCVYGVCSEGHKFRLWSSQPFVGHMPLGNLLISGAILCSGCNYQNISSFFTVLKVPCISKTTYCNNQKQFLFPSIDHHWKIERAGIIQSLRGKTVALAGDGQCDLYSFNAKYCTYSFLEYESKKIIDFQVEQLNPDVSSVGLRKRAFKIGLDRLKADGVNVRLVATDHCAGIRRLLKNHYSNIQHQFDVWHLAKSIGSKLSIAAKKNNCSELSDWIVPTKKHLWWASSTCHHDPTLLKEKWRSITYHALNVHQWDDASLYHCCHHPPLTPEQSRQQKWLQKGSTAECMLRNTVQDARLLRDIENLSSFLYTEEFEVYQSTSLKYKSKRFQFFIDNMVARSQLAALDYNHNVHKMGAVVKHIPSNTVEKRYFRSRYSYSKMEKDCVVSKHYKPINQLFIWEILRDALACAAGTKQFQWNSRRTPNSTQL